MKKFIVLAVLLAGTLSLQAQEPMFVKGDRVANLGVGITSWGMVGVSLEQCLVDGIIDKGSIGAGIYAGAGIRTSGARFVGGVRGTFHYPFIDKFDTYIGIGGGLQYRYWFNLSNDLWPDVDGFIGARYAFSDKLKLFCEFGASLGWLSAGISLNL
jgi:hypothetical protein